MRATGRGRAGGRRGRQAAAGLLCLLAAGCSVPDEVNPVAIYRRISGLADADRLPPPGMDRPTPSLGTVPPRPERPPVELRTTISDALAQDRSASRGPLVLRNAPAGGAVPTELSDQPAMPAAPPSRPALAAAPPIPWGEAAPRPQPGRAEAPAASAPLPPEMPEAAPAPPPPELLGPPPAPRP